MADRVHHAKYVCRAQHAVPLRRTHRDFLLEEGDFGGGPVEHAVAGEAEERGGGVAWLGGEIEGDADGVNHLRRGGGMREPVGKAGGVDEEADGESERVGAQPFRGAFLSRRGAISRRGWRA